MKYVDLVEAFEMWLETHYLPGPAQLLWYKLILIFKRCGWSEWITVDNHRLMSKMQIDNEKTFIRYRDKLIEEKFFIYKKGKKSSPNQYKINTVNFAVFTTVNMTAETTVNMIAETTDIRKKENNIKKESKKENIESHSRKTFNQLIEEYTSNKELEFELKNHLAIRKRAGSLTNRSIEIGFENLDKLTKNISSEEEKDKIKIQIVKQATANGTSAFLPLKEYKKTEKTSKKKDFEYQKTTIESMESLYDN